MNDQDARALAQSEKAETLKLIVKGMSRFSAICGPYDGKLGQTWLIRDHVSETNDETKYLKESDAHAARDLQRANEVYRVLFEPENLGNLGSG